MTNVDELQEVDWLTETRQAKRQRCVAIWVDRYGALRRFWIATDHEELLIKTLPLNSIIAREISPGLFRVPYGKPQALSSYGAPVTLRVRIDQHEIDDVKAVVMPNLNVSLLGQSFLNRLHSYEMHDGVLTLTW